MSKISEKVAYLDGLMEGLDLEDVKLKKLFTAVIDALDEIAEEIADVQIAREELTLLFGVPVDVQIARRQKLARLEMRIEKAREERGDNREHTAHWEDPGQKGDLWYAKLNGPGPDPKGARGAWGHCPKCGASDCERDAETDVCTCKACGYTN